MENHGSVTYGANLLEAFLRTETLEHLAQVALACHQLGSPRPLGAAQVEQLYRARMNTRPIPEPSPLRSLSPADIQ